MSHSTNTTHRVMETVGKRLLQRLSFIRIAPEAICALGFSENSLTDLLHTTFATAQIHQITAQALSSLPDKSIDLCLVNLFVYQMDNLASFFAEIKRILRSKGLFLFSCYGPDTFLELRRACEKVQIENSVNIFFDMHDIGDALRFMGLYDPVMDREVLNLVFSDFSRLQAYAREASISLFDADLAEKKKLGSVYPLSSNPETCHATLEIIYGHAWQGEPKAQSVKDAKEIHIAVDKISRTRK